MKEQRLDCPYDFTSRCTMGRCDCKPKQETLEEPDYEKIKQALIEFRKTPITFVPDKRMYSEEDMFTAMGFASAIDNNMDSENKLSLCIDFIKNFKNK